MALFVIKRNGSRATEYWTGKVSRDGIPNTSFDFEEAALFNDALVACWQFCRRNPLLDAPDGWLVGLL